MTRLATPFSQAEMDADTSKIDAAVERLRAGDPQALAELFSLFREPLRRMIALRLDPRLAGRVSASDVLQDSYLEAAKRLEHLWAKPDMPPLVWLRLIAGQRLMDVHRQHLGAQMRDAGQEVSINRPQGFFAASSMCLAAQLIGHGTSPSEAVERMEQRAKLEQALESLDPIDREVLALRHFEELGNRETAAVLGIEPSAASKRYLRALERLRALLETMPGALEQRP